MEKSGLEIFLGLVEILPQIAAVHCTVLFRGRNEMYFFPSQTIPKRYDFHDPMHCQIGRSYGGDPDVLKDFGEVYV